MKKNNDKNIESLFSKDLFKNIIYANYEEESIIYNQKFKKVDEKPYNDKIIYQRYTK